MKTYHCITILFCFFLLGCSAQANQEVEVPAKKGLEIEKEEKQADLTWDKNIKTIHILVALCDNKYQGIVPVPERIGNGQDPGNNLYWGAAYGIKTFFRRSEEWDLIETVKLNSVILERSTFKHKEKDVYLIADAYDGQYIKQTTEKFLQISSGLNKEVFEVDDHFLGIGGHSKLIAYIGHDGLMDFNITDDFENEDGIERDVIILACYSKTYFNPHLENANVNPLVWTTGLMAPEAYTIHDAISGYLKGESNAAIKTRAAKAYSKYQKCSLRAAERLLATE